MDRYFNETQHYLKVISDENTYSDQVLRDFMLKENVEIEELMPDGTYSTHNTTFSIGMQRYLSKLQTYITMPL